MVWSYIINVIHFNNELITLKISILCSFNNKCSITWFALKWVAIFFECLHWFYDMIYICCYSNWSGDRLSKLKVIRRGLNMVDEGMKTTLDAFQNWTLDAVKYILIFCLQCFFNSFFKISRNVYEFIYICLTTST